MKAFQLTAKKKIALKLLAVIAVVLVIYIINIQTNYMECLKNPEITENYIGLWKSHWHEENKAWLYPAKQYAIYAVTALASLSVWVAASKVKFWK